MPITLTAQVVGLGVDTDPFTGARYTSVQLAIETNIPPPQGQNQYPPIVATPLFKHVLHIYVPSAQWRDQYRMWSRFQMIIEDNGQMRLDPVEVQT